MMSLNPLTAVTAVDPYPYYAQLVQERPFSWDDELHMWVAASAQAVQEALTNSDLGVRPPLEPVPHAIAGTAVGEIFAQWARMTEGVPHELARAEACARIAAINCTKLHEISAQLAARIEPNDLKTFAFTLPALAMARVMGIEDDAAADWTQALVRSIAAGATDDEIAQGCEAVDNFRSVFGKMGITEPRGAANAIALLFQTYDATAALIGNGLVAFAKGTALPAMPIAAVVAEISRYDSPVQNTRRFAVRDTSVLNTKVADGDTVLVVLAAANRDPSANPEPHRFEIAREDRRIYTFGVGAHACPGARIACTIATAALECLLESRRQLADLEIPAHRTSPNIRMPDFA